MIGEFDIAGVFIPTALVMGVTAFIATLLFRHILRTAGAYQFIWHAGLFDVSMYVFLWWLIAWLSRSSTL